MGDVKEVVEALQLIAEGWTVIESDGQVMTIQAPDDWDWQNGEEEPRELVVDTRPASTGEGEGWGDEKAAILDVVQQVQSDLQFTAIALERSDPNAEIVIRVSDVLGVIQDKLAPLLALPVSPFKGGGNQGSLPLGFVKPDTDKQVFFYEQDFYVLSNFSSFAVMWELSPRDGLGRFDTSEALYHWFKFSGRAHPGRVPTADQNAIARAIQVATSAHEAFKIAERHRSHRRRDWDDIKVGVMKDIIRAKADQHEYVRRKLLATGDRELVEDSWRDDFWGWGPNRDGQNMLGKLWMEVRAEVRAASQPQDVGGER